MKLFIVILWIAQAAAKLFSLQNYQKYTSATALILNSNLICFCIQLYAFWRKKECNISYQNPDIWAKPLIGYKKSYCVEVYCHRRVPVSLWLAEGRSDVWHSRAACRDTWRSCLQDGRRTDFSQSRNIKSHELLTSRQLGCISACRINRELAEQLRRLSGPQDARTAAVPLTEGVFA